MDKIRRYEMRDKFALGLIGFALSILGALLFLWAMFIAPYQIDNDVVPFIIGGGLFILIGGVSMAIAARLNND